VVPYGDVEATGRALAEVLADGERARMIRANARAGAADRTVARMVDETLAVFYEALGTQRPGGVQSGTRS
jgi:hypothetical protein